MRVVLRKLVRAATSTCFRSSAGSRKFNDVLARFDIVVVPPNGTVTRLSRHVKQSFLTRLKCQKVISGYLAVGFLGCDQTLDAIPHRFAIFIEIAVRVFGNGAIGLQLETI